MADLEMFQENGFSLRLSVGWGWTRRNKVPYGLFLSLSHSLIFQQKRKRKIAWLEHRLKTPKWHRLEDDMRTLWCEKIIRHTLLCWVLYKHHLVLTTDGLGLDRILITYWLCDLEQVTEYPSASVCLIYKMGKIIVTTSKGSSESWLNFCMFKTFRTVSTYLAHKHL